MCSDDDWGQSQDDRQLAQHQRAHSPHGLHITAGWAE